MKKLELIIIANEIGQSRINDEKIHNLPNGLRQLLSKLLLNFKSAKRIVIFDEDLSDGFLELEDRIINLDLDQFGELRPDFTKTFKLYFWYCQKHFISTNLHGYPPMIDCKHCHQRFYSSDNKGFCHNPECPSHDTWTEIIGPHYQKPTELSNTVFEH